MAEIRREETDALGEGRRQEEIATSTDPDTGQVVQVSRSTREEPSPALEQGDIVTTTDPVTGQVVRVNRATGQVETRPGVTQATYTRSAEPAVRQQEVRHASEDPYAPRRARVYKLEQAIYLVFGIIEGLIAIRFVLRLLGANPNSGFGSFIYGITAPFIAPFVGLFGTPAFNGSVLELHSIVAIVVYALIAWLLVRVVWLLLGETRTGWRASTERIDRHV